MVFRIIGWKENKELDDIEKAINTKEKKEPHCNKCEHLGKRVEGKGYMGTLT